MNNRSVKTILALFTILACAAHAHGQGQTLTIRNAMIEKNDETVIVEFRGVVGDNAVSRNGAEIFALSLRNGDYVWSLPAVIVQGRKAKIYHRRQLLRVEDTSLFDEAYYATNGAVVNYYATAPYQEWMEGAELSVEALRTGCGTASPVIDVVMAEELVLQPEKEPDEVTEETAGAEEEVKKYGPLSTGEKLQESYSFIAPASEYRVLEPGALYEEDRDNTITVFFPSGSSAIERNFSGNAQAITDLMSSIRILEQSHDSRVTAIVVAGFSSPEGGFELNDRLAWNRAVAMKRYIISYSGLDPDAIKIYNGSVDWQGLRMQVEADDMQWREKALDIIDNTPVWDGRRQVGRLGELMKLNNGEVYRFMMRYYFPKLRNAAYIKIYYENK